jgi:hypothetical protein
MHRSRNDRRGRPIRPCLSPLERRIVPTLTFPGIAGIAFDSSGDVFVSYDSTTAFSGQKQSVAEVGANGFLASASVFGTSGASAFPGALTAVGSSASLPSISSSSAILELQPNGQLFVFDPVAGTSSQYDNLANDTVNASKVYDVQTGASVSLGGQISLSGATYGDFGIYKNSLVVSAESNNWDFVMRVTYGSSGNGAATVLAASPASDGLSASPGGVAVDSQGTVLATMPYVPAGSNTAIHVPVGFSLNYDTGSGPAPFLPKLGLSSVPNIDSGGIAVDSQNNFILAVSDSSLYGGGQGIVHINGALTAFLADPTQNAAAVPSAIACQDVGGSSYLAFTDTASDTYTVAGELPLFSGQVSPAQLRHAYGIDQITFTGPGGTTVTGDGSGQTIAIVEEGVDPTLGADLATFDQFFGIPAPPSFKVVDQNGSTTQNLSIVGEASLDVEWAHAIAPGASIVVYNAQYLPNDPTTSFQNLMTAMQEASNLPGVSVVSLSYGLPENAFAGSGLNQQSLDANFTPPGVTFVVASGDSGAYGNGGFQVTTDYPASSPNVVSVGGTSIVIDSAGNYPGTGPSGEVAWGSGASSGTSGGGGGGLSANESQPTWQRGVVPTSVDPTGARAVPDVAMDSGSAQQYDVFTSTLSGSSVSASAVGWLGDAGTSAAAPIWSGLIAIADQGRALAGGTPMTGNTQTLPALYSLPAADFHDIVNGNNGYAAGPGYDLTSGRGTPIANLLVPALAAYQLPGTTGIATQVAVTASPPAPVFGQSVTLAATVSVVSPGTGVPTGSVTFKEGSTVLGTATLVNGVAQLSTTPSAAGSDTFTIAYSGDDQPMSVAFPLTVAPAAATLDLGNLSFTYDGSSHSADVTTSPAGLSGVTVTYTQNGVTVTSPTTAGDYTVTATLNNPNYTAPAAVGTLVIGQATPTLTWTAPADINVGTPLGAAQLDAIATFGGNLLPGDLAYSPPAGTVLPAGNGQSLMVSFTPTDTTDFKTVTSSVNINVLPQSTRTSGSTPTPTPAMVIGEQPVFQRKVRKDGKPFGKAVLTGFTLDFNVPLGAAAAANPGNYQLNAVRTRTARKKLARTLQPVKGFTVTYTPATDSVTLSLTSPQSFATGGQITILQGLTGSSSGVLEGTTVFTITPGGKHLVPT